MMSHRQITNEGIRQEEIEIRMSIHCLKEICFVLLSFENYPLRSKGKVPYLFFS